MSNIKLPETAIIKQTFHDNKIADVADYLKNNFFKHDFTNKITPGQKVAITVGSRAWANRVDIVITLVELVRSKGGEPCVIATMGSHGGANVEGRLNVLKKLGVTPETIGAPVISTPDVTLLGTTESGLNAFTSSELLEVDWVIIIGRAKPHTSFSGPVESGFHKMISVGMGKVEGARTVHSRGSSGMCQALQEITEVFLGKMNNILCGILLVENAYVETAHMHIVPPSEIVSTDKEGLKQARKLVAGLPLDRIDVLLVDEMGKNYSGTGIDPKTVGRMRIAGVEEPESPIVKRVGILDISSVSDGNATGVGMADFITEKLRAKIDFTATYVNCITSGNVMRGFVPIVVPTEMQLLRTAISSIGSPEISQLRYMRIKNTMDLSHVEISKNLISELEYPEVVTEISPLEYDKDENLISKWIC